MLRTGEDHRGRQSRIGADDDGHPAEAVDPGDDVHEVGRGVDARDDRRADGPRHRQVRDDPADDEPARDEEEDRPDQDDRRSAGQAHATAAPARIRSATTPTATTDGGLVPAPAPSSAGGSTAGR